VTGSDADGGDLDELGHLTGELGRNALEHEREGPGRLDGRRRCEERRARLGAAALDLEAAELVNRLRGQAEVGLDRNLGRDQRLENVDPRPFDLHRRGASLLDEAQGVGDRLLRPEMEGAERHVGDEESALQPASHRFHVMEHLVHGHRQRVGVAQDHHGERIADQDHVDARGIGTARLRVVVGGDHHQPFAPGGGLTQLRHTDLLARIAHPAPPRKQKTPPPAKCDGRVSRCRGTRADLSSGVRPS
jgi:hypothetical protein